LFLLYFVLTLTEPNFHFYITRVTVVVRVFWQQQTLVLHLYYLSITMISNESAQNI